MDDAEACPRLSGLCISSVGCLLVSRLLHSQDSVLWLAPPLGGRRHQLCWGRGGGCYFRYSHCRGSIVKGYRLWYLKDSGPREFPSGLVVGTWRFHHCSLGLTTGWETRIPHQAAAHCGQKKKKRQGTEVGKMGSRGSGDRVAPPGAGHWHRAVTLQGSGVRVLFRSGR